MALSFASVMPRLTHHAGLLRLKRRGYAYYVIAAPRAASFEQKRDFKHRGTMFSPPHIMQKFVFRLLHEGMQDLFQFPQFSGIAKHNAAELFA